MPPRWLARLGERMRVPAHLRPIGLRSDRARSVPAPSRGPGTAVEVVGALSLVELLLTGTDQRIPCLEAKLVVCLRRGEANPLIRHCMPLTEITRIASDRRLKGAISGNDRPVIDAAARDVVTLGGAQLAKAYHELNVNRHAMVRLLRDLGHEAEAQDSVLVESLPGDDNFPALIQSTSDLERVGQLLFAPDMVEGWLRREAACDPAG